MKQKDNLYDILGVTKSATQEEISKAYKSKARQFHPDRFTNDKEREKATEKFQEISEAYRTLSDEEKRRIYDTTGTQDGQAGGGGWGGFNSSNFGGGQYQFYDMYDQFGGGFAGSQGFQGFDINDFFNMFSGGGGRRQSVTKYSLDITIEEAFLGAKKTVMITENIECNKCSGSKTAYCSNCKGARYIKQNKQQEINIPAGIKSGDAISINSSTQVAFNIKSNKYTIEGINLSISMEISDDDFRNNKPLVLIDLNGTSYSVNISSYKTAPAKVIISNKGLWSSTSKTS